MQRTINVKLSENMFQNVLSKGFNSTLHLDNPLSVEKKGINSFVADPLYPPNYVHQYAKVGHRVPITTIAFASVVLFFPISPIFLLFCLLYRETHFETRIH
jgi:hypothetical protein